MGTGGSAAKPGRLGAVVLPKMFALHMNSLAPRGAGGGGGGAAQASAELCRGRDEGEKPHSAEFDGVCGAGAETTPTGNVCSQNSSKPEHRVPLGPNVGSKRSPSPLSTPSGHKARAMGPAPSAGKRLQLLSVMSLSLFLSCIPFTLPRINQSASWCLHLQIFIDCYYTFHSLPIHTCPFL